MKISSLCKIKLGIMDKKKVKEFSVKVLADIAEAVDKTNDAVLKLTLANIAVKIAIIYVEVDKSPWVSVKDELPPYDVDVLVSNENEPEKIWFSHRIENPSAKTDENGFLNCFPITHWRKIDKLGEN